MLDARPKPECQVPLQPVLLRHPHYGDLCLRTWRQSAIGELRAPVPASRTLSNCCLPLCVLGRNSGWAYESPVAAGGFWPDIEYPKGLAYSLPAGRRWILSFCPARDGVFLAGQSCQDAGCGARFSTLHARAQTEYGQSWVSISAPAGVRNPELLPNPGAVVLEPLLSGAALEPWNPGRCCHGAAVRSGLCSESNFLSFFLFLS